MHSTGETTDVFNKCDGIILVFTEKRVKFLFIFFCVGEITGNKLHQTNFFPGHFSLIFLGSACLVGIVLGLNTVAPRKWFLVSF